MRATREKATCQCLKVVYGATAARRLFRVAAEDFLTQTRRPGLRAQDDSRTWHFGMFVHQGYGETALDDITPEQFRDYFRDVGCFQVPVTWRLKHGKSVPPGERVLSRRGQRGYPMWRTFFAWAVADGRCTRSPMDLVDILVRADLASEPSGSSC